MPLKLLDILEEAATGVVNAADAIEVLHSAVLMLDASSSESLLRNAISLPPRLTILSIPSSGSKEFGHLVPLLHSIQPTLVFAFFLGTESQLTTLKKLLLASNLKAVRRVIFILPTFLASSTSVTLSESLALKFIPFQISVSYCPIYLCPILPSQLSSRFEVHIFSTLACRSLYQPRLSDGDSGESSGGIADRLKTKDRLLLKRFSHELAGALIYDLGLDPTHRIFARGKVSSLVGHSIESCIAQLQSLKQKKQEGSEVFIKEAVKMKRALFSGDNRCSLILLDRNEDILAPLSHQNSSLAHRILSCLPRGRIHNTAYPLDTISSSFPTTNPLDVTLLNSSPLILDEYLETTDALLKPFSGVASLGRSIPPSLHSNSALLLLPEEEGCKSVCNQLANVILQETDTPLVLPSKKRGMGAETLARTQAVMKALKSGEAWVKRMPLLSNAVAIIEAMQRSSGKQFSAVCDWKCSFEVRQARESLLLSSLTAFSAEQGAQAAVDAGIEVLTGLVNTAEFSGHLMGGRCKEAPLSINGPRDVEHILIMGAMIAGTCRCSPSSHTITEFAAAVASFMIHDW